jgi:thiamine monophosphate synthase
MKNKYYYFCKTLNDKIKKNILKFSDISVIFYNSFPNTSSQELNKISSFCKKNNIPFYVYNNYQLAVKIKAQGIYLDSRNRNFNHLFSNKLKIIGSAHNQIEYFNKLKQGCDLIMLSPIFSNVKYSKNKVIGPIRFNLITNHWKTKAGALGGLRKENIERLVFLKSKIFGGISFIENLLKKPI